MGKYFQKITLVLFIFLISNSIFSQSIKTNAQASFVIKNDGTFWVCGSNEDGQLGDNSNKNQSRFVQVGNDTNWLKISVSPGSVLALKKDGSLWGWGHYNILQPEQIGFDNNWVDIGKNNGNFAIKADGTLWAWGYNSVNYNGVEIIGALGDSTLPVSTYVPKRVGTDTNWQKVFALNSNTFLIKKDGTLWGWGSNYGNQLLNGIKKDYFNYIKQIGKDSNWSKITEVSSGCSTFCGLKKDGTIWYFGNNPSFIKNDSLNYSFNSAIQINKDSNWVDIQDALALKKDGSLWSFNLISCGASLKSLQLNSKIIGNDWQLISTISYYGEMYNTLAVKKSGTLYSSGRNYYGQLGIGKMGFKYMPTILGKIGEWNDISLSNYGSVAVKSDSTLWVWGEGYGSSVPKQLSSEKKWKKIISGSNNSVNFPKGQNPCFGFGIKNDGSLWAWGKNSIYGINGSGILGDSTTSNKTLPTQIKSISNLLDITTSGTHVIALTQEGKIYAWGKNDQGQLGTGNKDNKNFPVQVGIDTNWVKVITGYNYTLALKIDGTLWSWGQAFYQSNSDSINLAPIKIGNNNDWKDISSGLLLKKNGSMYSIGLDASYKLGGGVVSDSLYGKSINRVGTDSNWISISGGSSTSFAIKSDSTLWSWGNNMYGALGIDEIYSSKTVSTSNYSLPRKINSDKNWRLVRGGGSSAAIKNDGSLWVWGRSDADVLGFNDSFYDTLQNTGFQVFIPKVSNPVLTKAEIDSKKVKLTIEKSFASTLSKINIYKSLSPISDTSTIKEYATLNSIDSTSFTDSFNVVSGNKYFYRIKNIYSDNTKSDFSNELYTLLLSSPNLLSPANRSLKNDTSIVFKWSKADFATNYVLELGTDSLFANTPIRKNIKDTLGTIGALDFNKDYYWRVASTDTFNISPWSKFSTFQTILQKPKLDSVNPVLRTLMLKWSNVDTAKIKFIKIYRDTIAFPTKLIDSISGKLLQYNDKFNIQVNQKYFYRLIAVNNALVESEFSNVQTGTPFNTLPKSIKLSDREIKNVGEYNFVKLGYSASGSKDPDGTISKYLWYVNDSLVNQADTAISYFFKLGTNSIKLVVIDNDNGRDSSIATVKLTSLTKKFKGGVLGGISALNQNTIITADSSYDPILGSSIVVLDRNANTILPLSVQSKIFTTPSISSDSLIFITNGSNLNGYSKTGVSLWSTIALGGISYVTPTIDSALGRIYLGVANKNFFAYDYKTGKNVWSFLCDAPINSSAVITLDRKLIFTSQTGTLYGFDISKADAQTTPKWKVSFGDIVLKSPAVDANNDIYVGTDAGRFVKFKLNSDGSILVKWNITLSASIQSSPVIDADGNVYVGNEKGDFYKIDPITGKIIWSINFKGSIRSTPSINEYGVIYVATMKGDIYAINTEKILKWKYADSTSISANILYIKNMLYFANESGLFTGIYDNPNSITANTTFASNQLKPTYSNRINSFASANNYFNSAIYDYYSTSIKNSKNYVLDLLDPTVVIERKPIWGTFQGDFRRSGSFSVECPQSLSISRDDKGNLLSSYPYKFDWYKNGTLISGIDSNIYKPTENASYSIKSNLLGCQTVISQSYYYLVTDVINLSATEFIKLIPNPFVNQINFDFSINGYQRLNLEVYQLSTGALVTRMHGLNAGIPIMLGQLSGGTYIFRISSADGKISHQFKMIKM